MLSGRTIAARVLERVLTDSAFAAASLDAELSRHPQLDPRERALATELVYGVLRYRRALEERIRAVAPKPIKDTLTLAHLLLATYQMLVLSRVPSFAAVNAAVEEVRARRGARLAGFTNAVLRKLATGEPLERKKAVRENVPEWLLERLNQSVGAVETSALLGATDETDATSAVRLVSGRPVPEWLRAATPGRVSPRARRLERAGDLRALPGYAEGSFTIQEEGSQVVALLLGTRPGERVLDACAGRGQKASLLAEQLGASGTLWAVDTYPKKLDALQREFERLGLPTPVCRAVDWTVGTADVPSDFDRVLVDAPCTGTGTLRHRPEILLRLKPEDPPRLSELATRILRAAATRARVGGRVVFAVCSVLTEEAETVVASVADVLTPEPFDAPELSHWLPAGATSVRLLPATHGTDGYFIASFRRTGPEPPTGSVPESHFPLEL